MKQNEKELFEALDRQIRMESRMETALVVITASAISIGLGSMIWMVWMLYKTF